MSSRPYASAALLGALSILPAARAHAADIVIADAKIAGGKLVVAGTTAAPNTWVRLDGQTAAGFNMKSDAEAKFAFGIVYHPGDCIVDLQRLVSPTTLGTSTTALVANCGPAGVTPRGAWAQSVDYVRNDLVTYEGSTWRARRGNTSKQPVSGADWEQFAAAGEVAEDDAARETDAVAGADAPVPLRVPPTGAAGGDLAGNYPNPIIAPLAVTVGKIALGAVGTGRLASDAVTSGKILDETITDVDLATNSVGAAEIQDHSIANADIASDAVNSAKVVNESLTASDLATDSVMATEIADNSIDSGEISSNSLFAEDLAASSVGSSELQDGAVGTAELASNAVTSAKVANNSLTTADIKGADVNGGGINVPAGYVPIGRCRQLDASVGGATAGEAVVFSIKAPLQDGIIIYGQRVPSNGHVTFNVCNFSGATQEVISDLPVRVITFG